MQKRVLLLKKKGKKVIFDSHENVSEQILRKGWIPSFIRPFISKVYKMFEQYVAKRIDGVIIVTPSQVPLFDKVQKNLQMVTNFPIIDTSELQRNAKSVRDEQDLQVCFAGGISSQWNHLSIVNSLINIPRLKYCFAGPSQDNYLAELLNNPAWSKQVSYLGVLNQKGVSDLYEASICGIALLDYNTQVGKEGTLGNTKLFEYMKYGLPIICSDLVLWKDIIDRYDCGITVNPSDILEITNALVFFIDNPKEAQRMGMNGHRAFMEEFNWDTQVPKLLNLYEKIIKDI